MIKITGVDLVEFVKKVYDLSNPLGLGFLHFRPESLTTEEAKKFIHENDRFIISMDYVKGRSCKMDILKEGNDLFAPDNWYDHTDSDYDLLLSSCGIISTNHKKHNICCECIDCKNKQRG